MAKTPAASQGRLGGQVKLESTESADQLAGHCDARAAGVAWQKLERALEGQLPHMMRGDLASNHNFAVLFDNRKVANPAVSQFSDPRLHAVEQHAIQALSNHARVLQPARVAESTRRVPRHPFLVQGAFIMAK